MSASLNASQNVAPYSLSLPLLICISQILELSIGSLEPPWKTHFIPVQSMLAFDFLKFIFGIDIEMVARMVGGNRLLER